MEEINFTIDFIKDNKLNKTAYGFIYITTCNVNNKKYIGQKTFDKQYKWVNYLGSGALLKKAINKYGKECFSKKIIYIAYSKSELDNLEIQMINLYDASVNPLYYNIASGGEGGQTFLSKSTEEKQAIYKKISDANKGANNSFYGKHHSEEVREMISIMAKSRTGELSPRYGKHLSEEVKQKIRISNLGKQCGAESAVAKSVICLTTGNVFDTLTSGSYYYNIDKSSLSKCCKGLLKHCGKLPDGTPLRWMYYDEYLKLHNEEMAS